MELNKLITSRSFLYEMKEKKRRIIGTQVLVTRYGPQSAASASGQVDCRLRQRKVSQVLGNDSHGTTIVSGERRDHFGGGVRVVRVRTTDRVKLALNCTY